MSGRIVARTFAAAALTGLMAVGAVGTAQAAGSPPGGGAVEDVISLPDGFQPEGIAIGNGPTAYVGSLADGDVYVFDLRTGAEVTTLQGPGTPSVGLKVDQRGRLFIAGGPAGDARVVDASTGALLKDYQLTTGPAFINDVVLTRDGAWFTNSSAAELYFLPIGPAGALPAKAEKVPLSGDWTQVPNAFNANGIAETPDHTALLVIQSATATLFRVDPATGDATAVDLGGATLDNGDGLLVVGRTLYVVQNFSNAVAVVELAPDGSSGTVVDTITDSDFRVPTTVAKFGKSLFLPNARFDTPPTPTTEYSVVRIDR
ncbi:SMP-30/gluconolactonase/LRE family protein [Agromyces sp. NPDC057865]|uniref:SMP-30/gluconolactonase/LRE family protein n=1 Tax=Agromyces sp. NPDC057865 TaxID=3346267 RepID=UPI00367215A6